MTIDKMIEFVGVIRKVTPAGIRTYQIEATGRNISGSAVLIWHKDSKNMQAILDIFRGTAPLADAPEQQFDSATTDGNTTTSVAAATTTTTKPKSPVPSIITAVPPPSNGAGATTTAPAKGDTAPQSNVPRTAIVPDPAKEC
jgi:hypothetical protein